MSNVKLLTFAADDIGGTDESNYVLDWSRKASRQWASKHISWAMINSKAIIIVTTDDPVTYNPASTELDLNKLRNNPNFRFTERSATGAEVTTEIVDTEQVTETQQEAI